MWALRAQRRRRTFFEVTVSEMSFFNRIYVNLHSLFLLEKKKYSSTQKLLKNYFDGSTKLEVHGIAWEWRYHFKALVHTQKVLKNYFEGPAQLEVRDLVRLSEFDLIVIYLKK
jgi:hypothetical protein